MDLYIMTREKVDSFLFHTFLSDKVMWFFPRLELVFFFIKYHWFQE